MASLTCPICLSMNVTIQNLEVSERVFVSPKSTLPLTLAICADCGYATRIEDRDFRSNLAIQTDFFNQSVSVPERRYTKWPHRLALVAAEVRRLIGNKGRVLDIGCNTGMWLEALGNGWEKHGVELSPVAVEITRNFTKAKIFCGPIESYSADPNSFDLITAFAVIEHVSDPRMLVQWVFEHLKAGGLLVLMTGDRESMTALQMGQEWPLYASTDHVSFFSARSLCHLVENVGFCILRKEWRFMYMPWGIGSRFFRFIMKIKEILRWIDTPQHDHLYLYACKQ